MRVQDIMTRDVQTCTANTTLPQVVKLMREATCGIIPVIDAHGRIAGVVTDRDISMALIETARKPIHVAAHEVMRAPVHACAPDDDLRVALTTMKQFKVRRLPVVGDDGRLRGMLSIDDVIVRGVAADAPTSADVVAVLRDILAWPESPVAV